MGMNNITATNLLLQEVKKDKVYKEWEARIKELRTSLETEVDLETKEKIALLAEYYENRTYSALSYVAEDIRLLINQLWETLVK